MTVRNASAFALVLFALTPPVRAAEPPAVKLVSAPGEPPVVEIGGLDRATLTTLRDAKLTAEEWSKVARFVVDDGTPGVAKKPPVAGDWSVAANGLRFVPQFPLAAGVTYRAFCDPGAVPRTKLKGDAFTLTVSVPKPPPGPRVRVVNVFPSSNRLPENTLRIYIHFSGLVARGDVYKRVKLVRDDGKEIARPFVEIDEELWSLDGQRLTLLFDPGRIKRGLGPRQEHGPVLEEGRSYTLAIDPNWPDAEERPLVADFKKTFTVTAPDDEPVWPDRWKLIAPRAGSDAPLLVRLAKPLDHALLGRMLWVADAAGRRVDGTLTVGGGERVVSFAPTKPWAKGEYKLVIGATLEDVCGNRVGEPFEVDVFKPIPLKPEVKLTERSFVVK
ncbi:hypothetical protein [Frigoriglobus tundricola]|uniref:SbsA Ig-like domain-containing protein n=1 Tax=Frigoriglobus tundricola TaxID=2774151 RepID=A0A6M5YWX9_9BACT|nr:hypothetical protein [Frigoriglobus tundricola]QJW97964.1 hypothetical protein FTUN_5544 [Frigoriglobus tundricola]